MTAKQSLAERAKAQCDRFRREWGLPDPPRTIDVTPIGEKENSDETAKAESQFAEKGPESH